jgi:hypothetical protein
MNLNEKQDQAGGSLTNGAGDKKLTRSLRRVERKLDLVLAHLGYEEATDASAAELYEKLKRTTPKGRRARAQNGG